MELCKFETLVVEWKQLLCCVCVRVVFPLTPLCLLSKEGGSSSLSSLISSSCLHTQLFLSSQLKTLLRSFFPLLSFWESSWVLFVQVWFIQYFTTTLTRESSICHPNNRPIRTALTETARCCCPHWHLIKLPIQLCGGPGAYPSYHGPRGEVDPRGGVELWIFLLWGNSESVKPN